MHLPWQVLGQSVCSSSQATATHTLESVWPHPPPPPCPTPNSAPLHPEPRSTHSSALPAPPWPCPYLAKPVNPVHGLLLHSRVPPGIQHVHLQSQGGGGQQVRVPPGVQQVLLLGCSSYSCR